MGFLRRRAAEVACAVLLAGFAAVLLVQAGSKTVTTDELVIIPSGYAHLQGDFEPVNDVPPLLKMWSALPLLLSGTEAPPPPDDDQPTVGGRSYVRSEGFWRANAEHVRRTTFLARVPVVLVSVAIGVLVFALGRRLFGPLAGVLAVGLWVVEPTVLAHGRIVQTDMAATLCWLGFVAAALAYSAKPSWHRAAILGAVAGAGTVTKFSLAVLVPMLVVAVAVSAVRSRRWRTSAAQLAAGLVVALLVVNLTYGFDRHGLDPWDRAQPWSVEWVDDADVLLPTDFLLGIQNQWEHNQRGHNAGALGQYSAHGWWWYFPVAFALKTTIPFLVLAVGAVAAGTWLALRRGERRWLVVVVPFAVYLVAAMNAGLNLGVRYFLPAFPLLCIAAGAALARLWQRRERWARPAVAAAVTWCVVEAAVAYPNYVPYMNELACCRPTYEYLSDSNVEWGDAIGDLADWLEDRGQDRVQAALLGGFMTLGFHGVAYIDAMSYPQHPPPTEYIAIGASFLNGSVVPAGPPGSGRDTEEARVDFFAEYRGREPEAVIGDEIYVYRLTSTTR